MERRYALGLDSYDRLFPSQDTMPKGGFGNLIALPLQHDPREKGNSVFVDDQLRPYDDQWAHVSSIKRLTRDETQSLLRKVYPTGDVINVNPKRFVGPISCEFVDRFCLRGKTVRESSYLAGCAAAINQRTRSNSDYVITRKRSPYLPQMKQRHAGKSTKPSYFGWILRVKLQTPIFSSG
jgi:hypothetical protein